MVSVKVEELQASLDRYLAHVHAGEEVVVTDHGRAIARLVPYDRRPSIGTEDKGTEDEDFLESRILRRPERELPPDYWSQPKVLDPNGLFRRAVLEEREQNW
jgi:prevent-host-death family protein